MSKFSQLLLAWYDENKRSLPWRELNNPYYIWISEIMLQQTQVVTVIPYFMNFIKQFPTIEALAKSNEQDLMKAWEGLGYYSRARNLRIAANQIMEEFNGKMPDNRAELLKLQGIGPYTASAIASISFNEATPAIDGNAFRVFSRVKMETADIGKTKSRQIFEKIGNQLIDKKRGGDFNQAIMDLGATICTPKAPLCVSCPVSEVCLAVHKANPLEFPKKAKKIKQKEVYLVADLIINQQNKLLLEKRADTGVLKQMWLFPLREVSHAEYLSLEETAIGKVKHVFTHLKWHIVIVNAPQTIAESSSGERKFFSLEELTKYSLPKVQHKLLQAIPAGMLKILH